MKPQYRCNKCGMELFDSLIPIEHGMMGITVHPQKPSGMTVCEGTFEKVHL